MKALSELLQNKDIQKTDKGVNSARGEACENICEFLGQEPKDSFMYWMGVTKRKGMTPSDIHDMIKEAKTGKNPQGLFNYLMKK